MPKPNEAFNQELDALGEDVVRYRLAHKLFGIRTTDAEHWLQRKAQEREEVDRSRNSASIEEQMRIARSAKNAAWAAAIAAAIAATCAIIALLTSFVWRPA